MEDDFITNVLNNSDDDIDPAFDTEEDDEELDDEELDEEELDDNDDSFDDGIENE